MIAPFGSSGGATQDWPCGLVLGGARGQRRIVSQSRLYLAWFVHVETSELCGLVLGADGDITELCDKQAVFGVVCAC